MISHYFGQLLVWVTNGFDPARLTQVCEYFCLLDILLEISGACAPDSVNKDSSIILSLMFILVVIARPAVAKLCHRRVAALVRVQRGPIFVLRFTESPPALGGTSGSILFSFIVDEQGN